MRWTRFWAIGQISFLVTTSSSLFLNVFESRANAALPSVNNDATRLIAQVTYPTTPSGPSTPQPPPPFSPSLPNSTTNPISRSLLQDAERQIFELEFRNADVNEAVQLFEEYQGKQFSKYLSSSLPTRRPTVAEISETLYKIYQQTGQKPALSYVVSLQDELHLITIFPKERADARRDNSPISLLKRGLDKIGDIFKDKKYITQNVNSYVDRIILNKPRVSIEGEIEQLQEDITGSPDSENKPYLSTASALYNEIIKPQETKLKTNQIKTLIVAADSGLRSIPIAALYDQSAQKHFVEKYSFALIPSFNLTNSAYKGNLSNTEMLAIGISKSTQNQQALPAASVEVDTLTQNFWKGKSLPLLNENFTEQAIKEKTRAKHFDIIHLATHAEFKPGKADQSYIQMWNDKLLVSKLKEFAKELQWNSAEMVVLSACRTALDDVQAELGFAGLAVQTGVKTGVGSLWYVSDEGSLALMMEFYSQIKKGLTKAEALKQAQLAMLQGKVKLKEGQIELSNKTLIPLPPEMANKSKPNLKNPYYWSGVTVIGNWN
jgi:CHAT domain-containing protein